MIYGYARVSTKEQNLDRQLEEFKNYNIDKIYCEKKSGKNFKDRDEYQKLLKKLKKGDLLIIMSIDRLGRNYEEILNQWRIIVEDKKCDIQVLDFPMLNTRNGGYGLEGKFLSNIILQVLAYVAEKERQKIKERQAQGIAIAKAKGIHMGRPNLVFPPNADEVLNKYVNNEISKEEAMTLLKCANSTFYKMLQIKSLKRKKILKKKLKKYKHPKIIIKKYKHSKIIIKKYKYPKTIKKRYKKPRIGIQAKKYKHPKIKVIAKKYRKPKIKVVIKKNKKPKIIRKKYRKPKIKFEPIIVVNQVVYLKSKSDYKIVAYKKNGEKVEAKTFLLLSKKLYTNTSTIKNYMKGKNTYLNDDIEKIEKVYYEKETKK